MPYGFKNIAGALESGSYETFVPAGVSTVCGVGGGHRCGGENGHFIETVVKVPSRAPNLS